MLDAGIGWRLFDFFRVFFFNFNSVLPGNEMVIFFFWWGGGGWRGVVVSGIFLQHTMLFY